MANGANGGGSHLHAINRNRGRIGALEQIVGPYAGATDVLTKDDLPTPIGGVITLLPNHTYVFRQQVSLGTDVLEGNNVALIGNQTAQTILSTFSPNPMFSTNAPGSIIILSMAFINPGGPFLSGSVGFGPLAVMYLEAVFFDGDPAGDGSGNGSMGTLTDCDRVQISNSFFQGVKEGLKFAGTHGEVSLRNFSLTAMVGATAFVGIEILASAVPDIFLVNDVRFTTKSAADRAVSFSPSATYGSSVRLSDNTIRGPGTFMAAASIQKTDPRLIARDNEGDTAPIDSQFTGNATFVSNIVETVIGAGNQGVLLPVGNGNDTHEIFDGDAFVERFTLLGSTTQTQSFRYDGLRPRTFKIDLHCQLNRAGGGTVFIGLGLALDPISGGGPVVIARSVNATEVGNSASPGYTTVVIELEPGDKVLVRMSNNTNTANVIMNSANWAVSIM